VLYTNPELPHSNTIKTARVYPTKKVRSPAGLFYFFQAYNCLIQIQFSSSI